MKYELVEDYTITWIKVNLKNNRIQLETNLKNLGLDSFDLVRLSSDLEHKFNVYIDLKDVFEAQTIRDIANLVVDSNKKNRIKIVPQNIKKYPLTEQQLAIYISSVKEKGTCLYNIPLKLSLSKNIDLNKLRVCLEKLIHNHWELNVRLVDAGENMYFIYDSEMIKIEEYTDQEVDTFFRPFNLMNPPLARVGLSDTYLLMDIHHIIADGRSYHILITELDNLYQGNEISKPIFSYADYAILQKQISKGGFDKAIKHFGDTLRSCNGVAFWNENNVHCGKSQLYYLDPELEKICTKIKSKFSLTNTMLFFAAFCILLKKYTNQDKIVTSLTLMNRKNKDFIDVVGMFVNTLPMKIPDVDDMPCFLELMRNEVINLYNYQEVPLIESIKNADVRSSSINTSFIYQGQGINKFCFNGEICRAEWVEVNAAKFDLTFEVTAEIQGYTLRIEYMRDKISEDLVELMHRSYKNIIKQMYTCNKLSKIRIYDGNNYKQIISIQRKNKVYVNLDKCVHQIFSEIAQNNYEKAIVFEGCSITYQELERYSNSLAYELQNKEEMRLGMIIPVIANRSWRVIAAMLGILKAGGAYVLIERSCPKERLAKIFSEINACIVVTENYLVNEQYITIRLEDSQIWENTYSPHIYSNPNGLCYVIYTSGSTGIPKGIKISHRNVINYCSKNKYSIWGRCFSRGEKKIISVTNYSFDIFVTESLFALLNGMIIYLTNESQINSQREINALICKNQIEILQTTPTKMKLYLNDERQLNYLKILKVILLGGERLTEGIYSKLRKYTSARIFNVYGPAETTVWVSCKELLDDEINIGYPLANNSIYIMSDSLEMCPIGVPGELCIAGKNVGLGYLNNSELTRKKFRCNPYDKNEIIYLTGDIAKWNKQKEIEYIGRKDNQVKLNGMRIELEEIENAIGKIPDISSAVVILRENTSRQYLVAFYTASKVIDNKEIRKELEKHLMKYMIPSYFIKVDQFPISKNGKIDRKKLGDFKIVQTEVNSFNKPSNIIEQKIHDEICRLLNVSQIDIYSNLIENGMDSLTIMELVANLDAFGLYVNIQSVIDNPTIRGIANAILGYEKDTYFTKDDNQKRIQSLLLKQEVKFINRELGNILLTGCTGYLGVHILMELLKSKAKKIFCLVREKNGISPKDRFLNTVTNYFPNLNLNEIKNKVVIVNGDIEELNIIQKIKYLNLNTIIHVAATVKHFGQYDDFEKINIKSTQNLVEFSRGNGVFFVYISTTSVSGNSSLILNSDSKVFFDEFCLAQKQTIDNVYVRSKYEAECIIISGIENGLNGIIIRIGNLTNRTYDMKFQTNYEENAFLSRMRAIIKIGCIPIEWLENELEFSPVDEVAKAIFLICIHGGGSQFVYHVNSNKTITYEYLLKILKDINIFIKPVADEKFKQELFDTLKRNNSFIAKALIGIMTREGKFLLSNNVKVQNDITTNFLKKVGFTWTSIDADYLIRYVKYFKNLGYF